MCRLPRTRETKPVQIRHAARHQPALNLTRFKQFESKLVLAIVLAPAQLSLLDLCSQFSE
jgi:hypothetical protein